MSQYTLQYAHWKMRLLLLRLSVWGVLGVLLCLASALFYVTKTRHLALELHVLQQQVEEVRRKESQPPVKLVEREAPKKDPRQEVSEFYAMFPQGKTLADRLYQIHQTALKHHLTLNEGDYKLAAHQPSFQTMEQGLSRYEFVMPVTGAYPQIRRFTSEILAQQPALALTDFQMTRGSPLSPTVDARLVLVLFFNGEQW